LGSNTDETPPFALLLVYCPYQTGLNSAHISEVYTHISNIFLSSHYDLFSPLGSNADESPPFMLLLVYSPYQTGAFTYHNVPALPFEVSAAVTKHDPGLVFLPNASYLWLPAIGMAFNLGF
jgi:hypothetical protein